MYEILASIQSESDLDSFLVKTGNFKKKFYLIDYYVTENHGPHMDIKAIAISRNLTYIVTWHICCHKGHFDEKTAQLRAGEITEESLKEHPRYIPRDMDDSKRWFPLLGNDCFVDVFDYNGFALVDRIERRDG